MTHEDLEQWHKDWENKQVSGDAYALFLNTYINTMENKKFKGGKMKHQAIEILTKKGRIYTYLKDKLPESMQNCQVIREYEIEIPDERPNIEVDTLLWVWNTNYNERRIRCFSSFDELGNVIVFLNGSPSCYSGNKATYINYELVVKDK